MKKKKKREKKEKKRKKERVGGREGRKIGRTIGGPSEKGATLDGGSLWESGRGTMS
jgi:hypothetical protein